MDSCLHTDDHKLGLNIIRFWVTDKATQDPRRPYIDPKPQLKPRSLYPHPQNPNPKTLKIPDPKLQTLAPYDPSPNPQSPKTLNPLKPHSLNIHYPLGVWAHHLGIEEYAEEGLGPVSASLFGLLAGFEGPI